MLGSYPKYERGGDDIAPRLIFAPRRLARRYANRLRKNVTNMAFDTEPTGYNKTALSDLQGAWTNLRDEVVKNFGFPESARLLFHIDEAMSWESVRDLGRMRSTLLLIENITAQTEAPEAVREWVHSVREGLEDAITAIKEGDAD